MFLFQACRILSIPQILTEQYPKGLGPTVPELGAEGLKPHTKTSFSMMTESVQSSLKSLGDPQQVILCGIEAQACIAVTSNGCLNCFHGTYYYQPHICYLLFMTLFLFCCSAQPLISWSEAWRFILWQMLSPLEGIIIIWFKIYKIKNHCVMSQSMKNVF